MKIRRRHIMKAAWVVGITGGVVGAVAAAPAAAAFAWSAGKAIGATAAGAAIVGSIFNNRRDNPN